MPTLREVRSRIVGVKKTQKITKAMKMVARQAAPGPGL
jgi:F0F1-type ATP synthase gamma subunit